MTRPARTALATVALLLASRAAAAWPERLELDLGGGHHLTLVLVHAATFRQGSPANERGRGADETPHDVTITRDFYMAEVPVLRGQFARFVDATGYRTESETGRSGGYGFDGRALVQRPDFHWRTPGFPQTDEHPAVLLTFGDATRFTAWASTQTGRRVRLPTEAEWELACRAGTTTAYYNGEGDNAGRAAGWFRDGSGNGTRDPRGRAANPLGLQDMVGHVQQWTADWYAPYPAGSVTDPQQTTAGSPPGEPARRVLRGGSWLRSLDSGRCAARSRSTPGSRNADMGLRVVVDAEAPPAPVVQAPPPPQPQPPVYQEPPPPSVAPSNVDDNTGVGLGYVVVLLAGLGMVVWSIRNRKSARDVKLVPQSDGFRIHAPASFNGSLIRYSYRARNRLHDDQIAYEHSAVGHFVYTGATPTTLTVVGVIPPRPVVHVHHQHDHHASHQQHDFQPSHHHQHSAHSAHDHHTTHHEVPSVPAWSGYDPPAY